MFSVSTFLVEVVAVMGKRRSRARDGYGLIEDPFWAIVVSGLVQLALLALMVVVASSFYGPPSM